MNRFESLLQQAADAGVEVHAAPMRGHDGLYYDECVILNTDLKTTAEKACVLAEELGHHYTASGDITGRSVTARKQENRGRKVAYEMLVPIDALADALRTCRSRFEIAEQLQITEEFLNDAVEHYFQRYGCCIQTQYGMLYFRPLGLMMDL